MESGGQTYTLDKIVQSGNLHSDLKCENKLAEEGASVPSAVQTVKRITVFLKI